jgi:hypothetical protein
MDSVSPVESDVLKWRKWLCDACLFIYLFIYDDGIEPGGYGPFKKQIKC